MTTDFFLEMIMGRPDTVPIYDNDHSKWIYNHWGTERGLTASCLIISDQ